MDVEIAKKTWELENNVETLPASDEIFKFDAAQQQGILASRPVRKFLNY